MYTPGINILVLAASLLIPLITLPLYRNKNTENESVLYKKSEHSSYYSKIGFVIGGVSGFIYSSVIINVCSETSGSSLCFSIVGIIFYTLGCAFGGFVLGTVIGAIIDFLKSHKRP